jgi:hypothetical protein
MDDMSAFGFSATKVARTRDPSTFRETAPSAVCWRFTLRGRGHPFLACVRQLTFALPTNLVLLKLSLTTPVPVQVILAHFVVAVPVHLQVPRRSEASRTGLLSRGGLSGETVLA